MSIIFMPVIEPGIRQKKQHFDGVLNEQSFNIIHISIEHLEVLLQILSTSNGTQTGRKLAAN
jgi:hypothetical protein